MMPRGTTLTLLQALLCTSIPRNKCRRPSKPLKPSSPIGDTPMPLSQMEAYLKVSEKLPIDDAAVLRRLERADREILSGYGYTITAHGGRAGLYDIEKLSTDPMGSSDTGSHYLVSCEACTCPDF